MKRLLFISIIIAVLISACTPSSLQEADVEESRLVTVYKLPTWGCCGDWTEYLKGNGFNVKTEDVQSLVEIKAEYQVPLEFQACHTAIVDGYVIEGHVPVSEIERLLSERPDVIGIAVAGMPAGSPGMEIEEFDSQPFDVISFDENGSIEIFESYK